jgi:hypothetical protein
MNKFLTYSARAKMLNLAESWGSDAVRLTASASGIRNIEPLYTSILDRSHSYATICDVPKVIIDLDAVCCLSPNCIDFDYMTQEFIIQRESRP